MPRMTFLPRARLYDAILADHTKRYRQMVFVTGPRQVGKTTTCRRHGTHYLNWDNQDDKRIFLGGPGSVVSHLGVDRLERRRPIAVFDELHKYGRWTNFLKGFFDAYGDRIRVVVTGSSRLDLYRRGGESLMGRYFLCRMHPFSIAEVVRRKIPKGPIQRPMPIQDKEFAALWEHGGYPEPFLRRESRFSRLWRRLRRDQLLRGDVRDLTRIQELGQVEVLGDLLAERSSGQIVYANLANDIQASVDSVRRWVGALSALYLGFLVRPWSKNVAKSLRKEPKWFLRDWSGIDDEGARAETFMACHLLKAVEGWTDLGLGEFELRYLRDKEGREVDFLVVRDHRPWFLVEVKKKDCVLSPSLQRFQDQLKAEHAFQAVIDLNYVGMDCFQKGQPVVVPARTLLSQLL